MQGRDKLLEYLADGTTVEFGQGLGPVGTTSVGVCKICDHLEEIKFHAGVHTYLGAKTCLVNKVKAYQILPPVRWSEPDQGQWKTVFCICFGVGIDIEILFQDAFGCFFVLLWVEGLGQVLNLGIELAAGTHGYSQIVFIFWTEVALAADNIIENTGTQCKCH